jgi:tetratricopeptide (TPR) repeat protein
VGRAERLIDRARSALVEATLRTGEFDRAEKLLAEALQLAELDGDLRDQAATIDQLGVLAHFRTLDLPRTQWPPVDQAPEREHFERALDIRRELGEPTEIAESLLHLGWTHQVLGTDWETSISMFREAFTLVGPDGDRHLRAELHRHIGFYVLLHDDRPADAFPHFQASLELWRSAGEPGWIVYGLAGLALCEAIAGRQQQAADHGAAAVDLARTSGLRASVLGHAETVLRRVHELAG